MGSFVVFFFDGRDEITRLFFTIDTTKKTPNALDFYE